MNDRSAGTNKAAAPAAAENVTALASRSRSRSDRPPISSKSSIPRTVPRSTPRAHPRNPRIRARQTPQSRPCPRRPTMIDLTGSRFRLASPPGLADAPLMATDDCARLDIPGFDRHTACMAAFTPSLSVVELDGRVRLALAGFGHADGATLQEAADELVRRVLVIAMAVRAGDVVSAVDGVHRRSGAAGVRLGAGPDRRLGRRRPQSPVRLRGAPSGIGTTVLRAGGCRARRTFRYCRARCTRSSASGSWMSSPLTSRVTRWSVPVKVNGPSYSGVTGEPGLAPHVRRRG